MGVLKITLSIGLKIFFFDLDRYKETHTKTELKKASKIIKYMLGRWSSRTGYPEAMCMPDLKGPIQ